MTRITLDKAHKNLPTLLAEMQPGHEIVISDNGQPMAHIKKVKRTSWPCKAGCYKKAEFWMASDFDAPLEEFKEYME